MNSNSLRANSLLSEMAFRVPVGRRRGGRGGILVANAEVMEELRILREEMAAMTEVGRRDPEAGDVSEAEVELEAEERTEEDIGVKLLKAVIGASSKPRQEIDAYNGGLNPKELVVWINSMDKHFDFSEVPEDKKVKFAATRLKGHALLWWDSV